MLIIIKESSLKSAFDKAVADGGNPRTILVNSPSNPTGQAFTEATVETIANFCKDHDITLISDDIYSDITFVEEHKTSPCSGSRFNEGQMVLTGGLSKACCVTLGILSLQYRY